VYLIVNLLWDKIVDCPKETVIHYTIIDSRKSSQRTFYSPYFLCKPKPSEKIYCFRCQRIITQYVTYISL